MLTARVRPLTEKGRAAVKQGYADTQRFVDKIRMRAAGVKLRLDGEVLVILYTSDLFAFANKAMIEKSVAEMMKPNGATKKDYSVVISR